MFKVIKSFKGSPDGMLVVEYRVGEEVDLTPDLAKVALEEKWVKTIAEKKAASQPPADPLVAEIEALAAAIAAETDPAKADELKAQLEAKQAELAAR